jgi:serine/threonine protein kinase
MVAVKIMIPDEDGEAPIERIQSEIGFLIELSGCPYIVSFLEGFHYRNNVWVRARHPLSLRLSALYPLDLSCRRSFFNTVLAERSQTVFTSPMNRPPRR